ncbi:hypothetical protein SAICODRAFT_90536 [Saitoella complicata NRRL Y-17804]|uniref:PQ-loop repeat-containing protein 1 n=1 Tax=Saitoella complicata (strain BCRC 22490 / CBS 7301 / JCM 7358 / NBRC 10748 / NRRL Y-17804) TaxID=698492 RepID=A0A0E9NH14_SAICN|nr:uncharacterized protein SAICODRAFT_90536 [Saitoella complicata NRRL Y-17804]ODQ54103.1 hypothetical protein SAICODRAFT_90536 [Saitoella complicata NRRL Y-17804]GAO49177.1 hypothetical protein G7K_3335-t1 [Saitoella complicata NRRL Y-17804]
MSGWVQWLADVVMGLFFISSPLTSYGDMIWSINKKRSSQGFSIDICGIMLVSSILRVLFWFGKPFETSLFIQAIVMIFTQLVLLKSVLDYRPAHSSHWDGWRRPFDLWQWRRAQTYWEFLGAFAASVILLQILLGWIPSYIELIGFLALGIEATLPIPQAYTNYRNKSCRGFRPSVLVAWIGGDIFKTSYFLFGKPMALQFKLCAVIQTIFDFTCAFQYFWYGTKEVVHVDGSGGTELPTVNNTYKDTVETV